MSIDAYRGYIAEGFAKPNGEGRFEAHGSVRGSGCTVQSPVLESFASSEMAQYRGLQWAREFIDRMPSLSNPKRS
jgi:hypothetical protein